MRYKEATEYLGRFSCAYKTHCNIFMIYDPFRAGLKGIRMKSDFRYDFAREMYSWEQGIASAPNPSRKPCSWWDMPLESKILLAAAGDWLNIIEERFPLHRKPYREKCRILHGKMMNFTWKISIFTFEICPECCMSCWHRFMAFVAHPMYAWKTWKRGCLFFFLHKWKSPLPVSGFQLEACLESDAMERQFHPEAELPLHHVIISLFFMQSALAFHHPPFLHAAEGFRRFLGRSGWIAW